MVSRVYHFFFVILTASLLLIACSSAQTPAAPTTVAQVATATPVITCDQLVSQAESSVGQICDGLTRNKACYGNHLINVDFQPNVSASFNQSGDIVDLLDIRSLTTSPLNTQTDDWGIAVIKAQANLPNSIPGENVTFLIYGDTTINNPSSDMHAVTVSTRIGSNTCTSVPDSAVVIQSPSGANVAMNINGSGVTLGSTAYITAQQNQNFTFAIIEGQGTISSQGITRTIPPGGEVQVPLGGADGLQASGAPSQVMPFDRQAIQIAPLDLLDRQVTVPQAIATDQAVPAATDTPTPAGQLQPIASDTNTPTNIPPTQPSPTTCAPRADWTATYTMQRSESLASIAQQFNITPAELQAGNCIVDPSRLVVGQSLRVPGAASTNTIPMTLTLTPTTASVQVNPNLRADSDSINAGDCTTIRWDVDNAQAVYFEGQPTTGHSSQKECPTATTTYTLLVQMANNAQQYFQITITVNSS